MPMTEIKFEMLEDGTISLDNGKIPEEIHAQMDTFMEEFAALTGERKTIQKHAGHTHTHIKDGQIHTHAHE